MQVVKLYGWEPAFCDVVYSHRNKEHPLLFKFFVISALGIHSLSLINSELLANRHCTYNSSVHDIHCDAVLRDGVDTPHLFARRTR